MSHVTNKLKEKVQKYLKRKLRVNTKIKSQKPTNRLVINKSNLYIMAQVIDTDGNVITSMTDKNSKGKTKTERAFSAGETFADLIKNKKLDKISFDRNGYLYHGRVKAFADGMRSAGIKI